MFKNTITRSMYTLNCKGKILSLQEPLIMGIINATTDSFYKGDAGGNIIDMVDKAGNMLAEGADIIDVGGQTTKPGSSRLPAEEEKERVIPVIKKIHQTFPQAIISVDTFYASVAVEAVEAGASIINDIGAGNMDKDMIPAVGALQVPYICMHMQGNPETMQKNPQYKNVTKEVLQFFIEKSEECKKAGILDMIIDPGFGFGKNPTHNFLMLKELSYFEMLGRPMLVGISRKGMVYRTLNTTVEEALNGTTVLNTIALMNGANILRVHDVKEAKETVTLFNAYKKAAL